MKIPLVAVAAATAIVALASACSKSSKPPAESSDIDAALSDVAYERIVNEGGPEYEAEACPPYPDQDPNAPTVQDEFVDADRPAAVGGSIKPGKYFLTKSEVYTGAGGNKGAIGSTIKRTVVFTENFFAYAEDEGTIANGFDEGDKQAKEYFTSGNQMTVIASCFEGNNGTFPTGMIEFSVVGDEIHLLISATQREVLTPAP